MDIPELLPVEKSYNIQINNVKTNIIKMLYNRGFILFENIDKYTKKLIDNNDDNELEFIINVDNDSNYNTQIVNKKIYVKFFDQKIISISKNSQIGNFISKYFDDYKLIIVESINPKTEIAINNYKTQTEVFKFSSLTYNVIDHVHVPKHIVLTDEDAEKVKNEYNATNKNLPLIYASDPIAKYYNMKQNNICKIIRYSKVSAKSVYYRICVNK